jgi:hypothetical protein
LAELADRVARLETERDALAAELRLLRERELEVASKLYRRGYRTGWAAAQRGLEPESAPERNARGWAREILA